MGNHHLPGSPMVLGVIAPLTVNRSFVQIPSHSAVPHSIFVLDNREYLEIICASSEGNITVFCNHEFRSYTVQGEKLYAWPSQGKVVKMMEIRW
jgi:hypothetical protein